MSELIISGVTKAYDRIAAIDLVNLRVATGTRTAIVGPSGSGKTTLLRLIAGFEIPDRGQLVLGGEVLNADGVAVPPHRRNVGYVAQEGALFPHLTIAANIAFGLPRDVSGRQARIAELMMQVGLPPELGTRRPHELSGGQQQRVALARAMARKPGLMLLDEPFSALDVGLRDAMREMVASVLGNAGITTILVTHDQGEALSFAEQLAVLRDGKLVQSGPPDELYERPVDPQTARFLGDALILRAVIANNVAHTLLGEIATTGADGMRTVLVRPEQVRLSPQTEGPSLPQGRVIARTYRGSSWRVVVEHVPTADETQIDGLLETASVFALTVSGREAPCIGETVGFRLIGRAHAFVEQPSIAPRT
jgi:iron(III) transport system ATP-binding protein